MSLPVPTYRKKWPEYARQWDAMEIKPARAAALARFCRNALVGKIRYQQVEQDTGVPWWMVAIIAERESSQNWERSIAQGDRWDSRSVNEPRGRGPFKSWRAAAYDALATLKNLDHIKDWRLEKVLYQLERYNGWGYHQFHNRMPSPYIWGGTTIQKPGKYIADHVWSSTEVDTQLGCAAMLRALMARDPTIKPERET